MSDTKTTENSPAGPAVGPRIEATVRPDLRGVDAGPLAEWLDLRRRGCWPADAMLMPVDSVEKAARPFIAAEVAAERKRCANLMRYWLAGYAPDSMSSYKARCLAQILDGSPASDGPNGPHEQGVL